MSPANTFEVSYNAGNADNRENKLTISFSSNLDNIDLVDEETRKFLERMDLEVEIFSISLVTREGLLNAVKHGHQMDTNKIVTYTIKYVDSKISIEIEDNGTGFDWKTAVQSEPDPEVDHGRGIAIMRHYFSDLKYNTKGNKLTLCKSIS